MIILKAGSKLGRYELIERLGRGAFAEVWKAKEASGHGFQKFVALKILKDEGQDGKHREALLREARLCANLRHPNIVDVLGVETDAELVFVAMEFVDGGTLEELIQKVARRSLILPRSVVVDIGLGISKAIHRAHHFRDDAGEVHQIIHRDLKPSNILLSRAGLPKVADFGLAKINTEMTATATGKVKGTPAYIAPEIWKGGRDFKPTCDLFALGAMLYEMVMLTRLFDGETVPAVFGQQVYGKPDEEAGRLDGRFPEMIPIVEDLLQRDPEKRSQEAAEVIDRLNAIRPAVVMAGEIEDFLELLKLSELTEEARATSSSSLRLPTVVDTGWHDLIHAATGQDLPYTSSDSVRSRDTLSVRAETAALSSAHSSSEALPPPPSPAALGLEPPESPHPELKSDEGPTSTRSMIAELPGHGASAQRRRALIYGILFGLATITGVLWLKTQQDLQKSSEGAVIAATQAEQVIPAAAGQDQDSSPSAQEQTPSETKKGAHGREKNDKNRTLKTKRGPRLDVSKANTTTKAPSPTKSPSPASSASQSKTAITSNSSKPLVPKTSTDSPLAEAPAPKPADDPSPKEPTQTSPTPQTASSAKPAAADAPGCLVLTSSPAGAKVWLNGSLSSHRARRGVHPGIARSPGPVQVQMGMGSQATAAAYINLSAASSHVVHCDLLGTKSCTASVSESATCKR